MLKGLLILAMLLFMIYLGIVMLMWMINIIISPFRKLFELFGRHKYDDLDDIDLFDDIDDFDDDFDF